MAFNVSEGVTYAVLYSVLGFFTLCAIASGDYFHSCFPAWLNNQFVLRGNTSETTNGNANQNVDFFLSARNSASATQIAFSIFASSMGAWVLYAPTEIGAIPSLSWIGVIGYAFASASPAAISFLLGPIIKARCTEASFNFTDFGLQRYGRLMQVVIGLMGIFYMFIFLVAELTTISLAYAQVHNDFSDSYTIPIIISLGAVTIFYTSLGGLPASIVTDKFQAVMMLLLVLTLIFAVSLSPDNKLPEGSFAVASQWTEEGLMAAVTLIFAVVSAEMFNLSTWQRVWAAKNEKDMKRGFAGASVLIFLLMMFFGILGMVAYALDPEAFDIGDKFAFLAFFYLLEPLAPFWHIVTLLLVTSLAASSIDSLQNGIMSAMSTDLVQMGWNPKWIARILLVILNVPAVVLSAKGYDVLSLFLVADLICATAVLPVFFGLMTEDKGIIPAPTEFGALAGIVAGVFTVCIIGLIVDAPGGLFEYFLLPNEGICALCGFKTMITFIVTPFSAGFFCLLFSKLDIMVRGERARNPLLSCGSGNSSPKNYEEGLENPIEDVPEQSPASAPGAENYKLDDNSLDGMSVSA